jgi:cytidylate kinase
MKSRVDIPKIDQVVSRQIGRWVQEHNIRARAGGRPAVTPGPYVTISREIGSGATALGQALAEDLRWKFYDRALLEEMSQQTKVSSDALEELEHGPHNVLHDAIVMALDRTYPGHHGYLKAMIATVTRVGVQGKAIILGRGAHYLLPPEYGLRLRLIAPLDRRLERVAADRGLGLDDAAIWVRRADENQRSLVRNTLHKDLDDPGWYDLILNMAYLDVEKARTIVRTALREKLGV